MKLMAFFAPHERFNSWREAFENFAPGFVLEPWQDISPQDRKGLEYALVWGTCAELLDDTPSLRVMFSLGAGVEHVRSVSLARPDIKVVRMVEPALTEGMVEYCLYQVLRFHRGMHLYEAFQRTRHWHHQPQRRARECKVGVMGAGVLGGATASALHRLDFDVATWSRTMSESADIASFAGREELRAFAQRSEILICLLALTDATRGIIDRHMLNALPRGAFVINAARGAHLVEQDLLDALTSGQIAGAALDVFDSEPLPPEHRFWHHPLITMTPHAASFTDPRSAVAAIVDSLRRLERGEDLPHVVDWSVGY